MKIICNQSELNTNLSLANRAVPSRPTHPVLGNVLVVADEDEQKVTLTGFDLGTGIKTSFNCQVINGGVITLPSKMLTDIISRLPSGDVTITSETEKDPDGILSDSILATIESTSGRFQIRGLDPEDYPELPTIAQGETLEIPVKALTDGIKQVTFCASSDETKQILTGVHFTGLKDAIEFAATDGHRLSVVQSPVNNGEELEPETPSPLEGFSITLRANALDELDHILNLDKTLESVTMKVEELQVIFEVGDRKLTCRRLEGSYPNYHQLIPSSFERNAIIDRKQLLSSLERVAVLADKKNSLVKFFFDGEQGGITLSVESQDLGSAKETISSEISGENGEIAFNVKYLIDGLRALPSKDVQIQWNQPKTPVILTPLGGVKMTYLIMPVQIRD